MAKTPLMRHALLYSIDGRLDQNHHQSNWQLTVTGDNLYKQGEEFTSYKNVLYLDDDLKSVFVMVKFKKNGSKEKMNYFNQQVVLMKYGKS